MPDQRQRLEELRARARYDELRQRAGLSEPPAPDARFETARQGTYNLLGDMADRAQAVPFVGGAASAGLNAAREIAMGDQGNRQSATPGFLGQAAKGAAFNFADEVQGGLAAAVQPLRNAMGEGVTPAQAYQAQTQAARDEQNRVHQAHPVASTLAQVGGGAASGAGVVSSARAVAPQAVAAGANMARQSPMMTSAISGLAGGALAGAGEGETPQDRRFGALSGGAAGLALGAAAPVAIRAAGDVGRRALHAAGRHADEVPRNVRSFLRQVPDETRAELADNAGENGPAFMGELLGARGERIMTDLAQGDDAAADFARMAARQRASQRSQRVMAEVQMRTGSRRGVDAIADSRAAQAEAAPLFRQADDEVIEVTPRIRRALQRLRDGGVSFENADRIARMSGRQTGLGAVEQGADRVRLGDLRDFVRDIEGQVDAGFTTDRGSRALAESMRPLARELREGMAEQSPAYRQAAAMWRDNARDNRAFEIGASVFDEGKNRSQVEFQLREFVGDLDDMTASERGQFMAGVLDAVERKTASSGAGGNPGSRLTREGVQDRLSIVFGDDEARSLSDVLARESYSGSLDRMYDPTMGSHTAPRQSAQGAVDEAMRGRGSRLAADAIEDVRGGTLGKGRRALARTVRSASPQQREQLAQMMFAPSDDAGASTLLQMIERERRRAGLFGGSSAAGSFLLSQQAASSQ